MGAVTTYGGRAEMVGPAGPVERRPIRSWRREDHGDDGPGEEDDRWSG